MSEEAEQYVEVGPQVPKAKFPNPIVVGSIFGVASQAIIRNFTRERLSARMTSYPASALLFATVFFFYDHKRRAMIDEIMTYEDEQRHFQKTKAIDNIQLGEEENKYGVMEFLTEQKLR